MLMRCCSVIIAVFVLCSCGGGSGSSDTVAAPPASKLSIVFPPPNTNITGDTLAVRGSLSGSNAQNAYVSVSAGSTISTANVEGNTWLAQPVAVAAGKQLDLTATAFTGNNQQLGSESVALTRHVKLHRPQFVGLSASSDELSIKDSFGFYYLNPTSWDLRSEQRLAEINIIDGVVVDPQRQLSAQLRFSSGALADGAVQATLWLYSPALGYAPYELPGNPIIAANEPWPQLLLESGEVYLLSGNLYRVDVATGSFNQVANLTALPTDLVQRMFAFNLPARQIIIAGWQQLDDGKQCRLSVYKADLETSELVLLDQLSGLTTTGCSPNTSTWRMVFADSVLLLGHMATNMLLSMDILSQQPRLSATISGVGCFDSMLHNPKLERTFAVVCNGENYAIAEYDAQLGDFVVVNAVIMGDAWPSYQGLYYVRGENALYSSVIGRESCTLEGISCEYWSGLRRTNLATGISEVAISLREKENIRAGYNRSGIDHVDSKYYLLKSAFCGPFESRPVQHCLTVRRFDLVSGELRQEYIFEDMPGFFEAHIDAVSESVYLVAETKIYSFPLANHNQITSYSLPDQLTHLFPGMFSVSPETSTLYIQTGYAVYQLPSGQRNWRALLSEDATREFFRRFIMGKNDNTLFTLTNTTYGIKLIRHDLSTGNHTTLYETSFNPVFQFYETGMAYDSERDIVWIAGSGIIGVDGQTGQAVELNLSAP